MVIFFSSDHVCKDRSLTAEGKTSSSALSHTSKLACAAPREENETNLLSFPKVSAGKSKLQPGIQHPLIEEAPVRKVTPLVSNTCKAQKPSTSFLGTSVKSQNIHPVQHSRLVSSASSCTPQSLPLGTSEKIPNPIQGSSTIPLQDACKTSFFNMSNFGSSLGLMSEDQILKHPILRVIIFG